MISFLFTHESLRFHRLKNQILVQVLFLIVLAAHVIFHLFPPGNPDIVALTKGLFEVAAGKARLETLASFVDHRFLIFFLGLSLLGLFTTFVSIVYAAALTRELDGRRAMEGVKEMILKLPQLLLMALLLIVPALLSLFFMGIPFIILLAFLAFTPLFMSTKQLGLGPAMSESSRMTKGVKLPMVISFFLLSMLMNLPRNLVATLMPSNLVAQTLIAGFFSAIIALMRGRLLGLYFVYFVNRFPFGNAGYYRPGDPRVLFAEIGRVPDDPEAEEEDAIDTRLPGDHVLPDDSEEDEEDDDDESPFPW